MKQQEILSVLHDLHKISGYRISLHDTSFNEIAAYPSEKLPICKCIQSVCGEYEKCRAGDIRAFAEVEEKKSAIIYKCRFGLTEAIAPLYNFGILTGYLMLGQIGSETTDKEELMTALTEIGIARQKAEELVTNMPIVSSDLANSLMRIMTVCARYLTLSNAMPSDKPSIAEATNKYIHENLHRKITIKDICNAIGYSKTTLIAAYKKEFGKTVNAAITEAKLEEAKRLLGLGTLTMNEIAVATGFYDQAYFSKVFSLKYGMPPSEYKREGQK